MVMVILFRAVLAVLLLHSAAVWADPVKEVRDAHRQLFQADQKGDIDAFLSHYADDAVVTAARRGFRIEGKQALKAHYTASWQQYPSRRGLARQVSYRVYNDGTVVIRNQYVEQLWKDATGQTSPAMLRLSHTWVKSNGRWLIVEQHASKIDSVQ